MRFIYSKKTNKKRLIVFICVRIIFLGFLCFLLFLSGQKIYQWGKFRLAQSCKIDHIDISWHDVFVTTPREELVNYLSQKMTDANFLFFDHKAFYSDLKNIFGWVKHISWKRTSFHHVQCDIFGYKPVCCINNEMLVMENRILMPQNDGDHDLVLSLPSVIIDQRLLQNSLLDEQVFLFCSSINPLWLNEYVLTYHDVHEIIMQSKKYRHITLVADQTSLHESKKFQAIELILKDLHKKKILYFSRWFEQEFSFMLDLRFKDRIVVKRFSRARETGSGS